MENYIVSFRQILQFFFCWVYRSGVCGPLCVSVNVELGEG